MRAGEGNLFRNPDEELISGSHSSESEEKNPDSRLEQKPPATVLHRDGHLVSGRDHPSLHEIKLPSLFGETSLNESHPVGTDCPLHNSLESKVAESSVLEEIESEILNPLALPPGRGSFSRFGSESFRIIGEAVPSSFSHRTARMPTWRALFSGTRLDFIDCKRMLRVVHDRIGGILKSMRLISYYTSILEMRMENIEGNLQEQRRLLEAIRADLHRLVSMKQCTHCHYSPSVEAKGMEEISVLQSLPEWKDPSRSG